MASLPTGMKRAAAGEYTYNGCTIRRSYRNGGNSWEADNGATGFTLDGVARDIDRTIARNAEQAAKMDAAQAEVLAVVEEIFAFREVKPVVKFDRSVFRSWRYGNQNPFITIELYAHENRTRVSVEGDVDLHLWVAVRTPDTISWRGLQFNKDAAALFGVALGDAAAILHALEPQPTTEKIDA